MTWRYQPVWIKHKETGITEFGMCEVYLTKDGKLKNWTEAYSVAPAGVDLADLYGSIERMAIDCLRWKPVNFARMRTGMSFVRLGSIKNLKNNR